MDNITIEVKDTEYINDILMDETVEYSLPIDSSYREFEFDGHKYKFVEYKNEEDKKNGIKQPETQTITSTTRNIYFYYDSIKPSLEF